MHCLDHGICAWLAGLQPLESSHRGIELEVHFQDLAQKCLEILVLQARLYKVFEEHPKFEVFARSPQVLSALSSLACFL